MIFIWIKKNHNKTLIARLNYQKPTTIIGYYSVMTTKKPNNFSSYVLVGWCLCVVLNENVDNFALALNERTICAHFSASTSWSSSVNTKATALVRSWVPREFMLHFDLALFELNEKNLIADCMVGWLVGWVSISLCVPKKIAVWDHLLLLISVLRSEMLCEKRDSMQTTHA